MLPRMAKQHITNSRLPRFRIEADYELVEILQKMGVARCFRLDQADFTGITATGPLTLDAVKHCALVEVNERGTEAAAVTALIAYGGIMEPPPEPVTFRADRPFVFLIQDNRTGAILFLGRLMKP